MAKIAKRMAEIKPFPEDDPYELARESIVDLEEIVEDGAELHAHLCQVYSACSNAYDVAQKQLDNPLTMDTNRWFSLMYTAKVIRVRTKFRLNVLLQSGIEVTAVKNDLIDYLYKES